MRLLGEPMLPLGLQGAARAQLILFDAMPSAVMQFLLAERDGQEPGAWPP